MRYQLFDFQRDAALGCLDRLARGRSDASLGHLSSFALSAVTGSGKTVVATSVIEAVLHGSADLEIEPDHRASFLWVTDDPSLNNQTRSKMLQSSELLQPARLRILDNDFLDSELSPGSVYFLNIQKLSKNSGLARGGVNLRQHSMWDILANTIKGLHTDLYLVLDEAHRGMTPPRDRASIVQRIISGQSGANPPMPIVWGISATIDRFVEAMKGTVGRTEYPPVEVEIDKVRASGLVKDEIGIEEPDEDGTFSTTLLREATGALLEYDRRWSTYVNAEKEPEVHPIMVVQVPDKASDEKLAELVSVIESEWPGLSQDSVVHVFGEHEAIQLPTRIVLWVPPESIQSDTDIRVVLAKQAISTGWDCPRAEVLYSERPAKDVTHIAQVVGRMVRQPLTHRVATDDYLNSVSCFLPLFDRSALGTIKAELEGRGKSAADVATSASVIRKPGLFDRSAALDAEVFECIETIQSLPVPDNTNPFRRAKELAQLLTDDASGDSILPNAGAKLTTVLNNRLDGLAVEHAELVVGNVTDLETTEIHRSRLGPTGEELDPTMRSVSTHIADIERDVSKIIRSIPEGVGTDYLKHRVQKESSSIQPFRIRTEVAALLLVEEVHEALESTATRWVQNRFSDHNVTIKNTTGATRDAFRRVKEQARSPEPGGIELRDNMLSATRDSDGKPLPLFRGHIYCDDKGLFPADLNTWETEVVQSEIARENFVAWYRNPSRAMSSGLRIAYQDDSGDWTSLQPDFVIVATRDDGSLAVSIVDPHGGHFADAKNKLLALADYAETFGESLVRVDSITMTDSGLRSLDLMEESVRQEVRSFAGAEVESLYEGDSSSYATVDNSD